MQTTLSSKGQLVLPAEVRRQLDLAPGQRLSVELREGGLFLQPLSRRGGYRSAVHPVSKLPIKRAERRPRTKVTAEAIARLHAELL